MPPLISRLNRVKHERDQHKSLCEMDGLSMETYFPLDQQTTPEINKQSAYVVKDPEWLEKLIKQTQKVINTKKV